jgi:hypothetical protein
MRLTDTALSDNAHVLSAELLLELPDQLSLDLVEALEKSERNVHNDGLASIPHFDLLRPSDEKVLQNATIQITCRRVLHPLHGIRYC